MTGLTPDFITVDGAEGGTGAAPLEFTDNIGMPLYDGYTVFTATVSDPTFNDCTVEARVAVDLAVLNMVSENVFVCEGDNTTLGVTLNGGVGTPTIVWSPDVNIVAGQGTTQITVLGVEDQIYTVTVTYPEPAPEGCTISGSVTLDVGTYGGAVTATIAEVEIFDVEKVQLFAKPDGLQYSWTPTAGLDNPNAQNPIYTPPLGTLGPITFTVRVTQPDGCNRTASVDLTVNPTLCDKDHVFLPNAFSPNGKGDVVIFSAIYGVDRSICDWRRRWKVRLTNFHVDDVASLCFELAGTGK